MTINDETRQRLENMYQYAESNLTELFAKDDDQ